MFPHPKDLADYVYPEDRLLQAFGVVQEDEICKSKQRNARGNMALPVVKNGLATGTTVGWVNGLDSITRVYPDYGTECTSVETAIIPYGKRGTFSAPGDSGAIILGRDGRIVALLTGGGGTTDSTDVTYATQYWWVEKQIKEAFPGCHLYPLIN